MERRNNENVETTANETIGILETLISDIASTSISIQDSQKKM